MFKGERFSPLYTDFYELTMAQGYLTTGKAEKKACFDYFFRKLPFGNGYVLFAGLNDFLAALSAYVFEAEDLDYLHSLGLRKDFLDYLKNFRFSGSIFAPMEGEVIFPNEPVLRVEGTILEAQLLETLLLNILNFESLIATKASRVRFATGDRQVMDFGLRRAQGMGAILASRATIIGGVNTTSNVYSAKKYGLTPSGTMAHSWIESFDDELSAFRAFAENYPDNSVLLVDTYDTLNSGLPNAIKVAQEMAARGQKMQGIRLDSGDLAYLSKKARKMLDDQGFNHVQIVASNQLDEHLIKSLLDQGAPIDVFGVGTNLIVGRDEAALDGVYKLVMFDEQPKLKISNNIEKIILPGVKKILRYKNEEGLFSGDLVLLKEESEASVMLHPFQPGEYKLGGMESEPLLHQVVNGGEITATEISPYKIGEYARLRLEALPEEHKRFENPHIYKVGITEKLFNLRQRLINEAKKG